MINNMGCQNAESATTYGNYTIAKRVYTLMNMIGVMDKERGGKNARWMLTLGCN